MKALVPYLYIALFFATTHSLQAQAPNYTDDVRPILSKYCVQCHQGKKAKAGISLDSYTSIMAGGKKGRKLVVANDADKSRLVNCVEGTGGRKMPPKTAAKQPTDKEIGILREWVKGGAIESAKEKTPAEDKKTEDKQAG